MTKQELADQVRQALAEADKRSPHEHFQSMIDRGIIDSEGRVLIRMPEPPPSRSKAKKKKTR
jgi:hypothetical protein